jgi:hypothetical protein
VTHTPPHAWPARTTTSPPSTVRLAHREERGVQLQCAYQLSVGAGQGELNQGCALLTEGAECHHDVDHGEVCNTPIIK